MDQNKWHAYDVWRHGMECMDACAGDPVLRIAALLHDVGKPRTRAWSDKTEDFTFYDHDRVGAEIAEPIAARLRFSNDERAAHRRARANTTCSTTRTSGRTPPCAAGSGASGPNASKTSTCSTKRTFVRRAATSSRTSRRSRRSRRTSPASSPKGRAFSTRDLKVNGHDLIRELGIPPGRIIGEILEALLELVISDPRINERDSLLARAREHLKAKAS